MLSMCGINGFNFSDEALVLKMNEATRHRGPDATGHFVDSVVSLGHNLLAITETPSNSRQPFVSDDKNFVLIFNGEIYNYRDLRKELEKEGEKFKTDSDTEVLFKGLIRRGSSFTDSLDGMFAFAFYDKRRSKIVLARDSSGIKPLYYIYDGKKLIFSSEIRGILTHPEIPRRLSYDALNIYFLLGYVPGARTLIEGIHKVCPGQIIGWSAGVSELRFEWFGDKNRYDPNLTYSPESLRSTMHQAVASHTQGLRPLGLYLSGGMDSSAIFYELYKLKGKSLKTFTTRFDVNDDYFNDDANVAKKITAEFGNDHSELLVKEDDFINSIEKVIECIEEPRWAPHITSQWLLAKEAAKSVTVILNGSGGDELFLGYQKQLHSKRIHSYYERYPTLLMDVLYTMHAIKEKRVKPTHFLPLHSVVQRWAYINSVWFNLPASFFKFPYRWDVVNLAKYLLSIAAPPIINPLPDEENAHGDLDRFFWLADEEFLRTDKITMHYGMEGRFPILARGVQQYANSIPSKEKVVGSVTKKIVREAYRGYLPDYVVDKPKTGWKAPVTTWMNSKLGVYVREVLSEGFYPETGSLFNFISVRKSMDLSKGYSIGALKKFMPIFSFQIWARQMKIKI